MSFQPRNMIATAALCIGTAFGTVASAQSEVTTLRIGHGSAVEEQLWLLEAMPELGKGLGTDYKIEMSRFSGTDKRFQAFEAGAIDIGTGSANSVLFAASQGIEMKIIASLSRESERGFFTEYMVREDSGIESIEDLKGKTLGINGFRSSAHLWVLEALRQAGLDPDSDVTFTPIRFPAQGEALKAGTIDLGAFPQPFARIAKAGGNVKTLFTSKDAVPFEEELMLLVAKPDFLEENEAAVKSFLADLVTATQFYLEKPDEARTALVESGMTRIPLEFYLGMNDYYRDPDARVDVEALNKMQDMQLEIGWQENRVDLKDLVDMSYLPE